MEENELRERLEKLEARLSALQAPAAPNTQAAAGGRLAHLSSFLIANWVLLSFVAALITAGYVKFAFGVDYFRDYRSLQAKSRLTTFYTHLGDTLMGRAEFLAAEDAYRSALQVDGSNTAATLGVVKAEIFKPAEGAQYYAPEVVDAKLAYLISLYPNDDQLMFLKGYRLQDEGNDEEAITAYNEAMEANPGSLGSYFQLAYLYTTPAHFDLEKAVKNLKRAQELDPELPMIYENLGYIYFLVEDFKQAETLLWKGYRLSPSWEKACSLADTYRSEGNPESSIRLRRWALDQFDKAKPNDRVLGGNSTWNYLPLQPGDRETIKQTVGVNDVAEKKAFTHYGLSFDYAVKRDFKVADQELSTALKLDPDHEYTDYFAEVSDAFARRTRTNPSLSGWFAQTREALRKAGS